MPISDVTVTIDLQRPTGLIGFGKPLILTEKAGGAPYKEYADLDSFALDYPQNTEAYKAASALKAQGADAPATFAAVAYDTAGDPVETLGANWDKDWYFLLATESEAIITKPIADYIEEKGFKMFATRTSDEADLATLKKQEYDRTFVICHSDSSQIDKYPDAAWVGSRGSLPVGSVTWKFSRLIGIAADTQNVKFEGGNVYVNRGGEPRTSEGVVCSGEYIDVIMSKDWVQVNIENTIQRLLNNSPKVPYTNSGIAQLEAATINVLRAGFIQGIIADNSDGLPIYSTNFPTRDQISATDRAKRKYAGATFQFELAGAIHEAAIQGTITV